MDKLYRLRFLLRRTMHFFLNICARTKSLCPGKVFPAAFFLAALWVFLPVAGVSYPSVNADSSITEEATSKSIPDSLVSRETDRLFKSRDSVLSGLVGEASTQPLQLSDRKPEKIWSLHNISYVLIVIGLLILFLHFLRKIVNRPMGAASIGEHFQVLQQFHMGPKKTISLVRVYNRLLLLGVTEATITTLLEITEQEEIDQILTRLNDSRKDQQTNFREIYQSLLSRFKK